MTDTLRIKRRTTGLAGAPGGLANAELAYNEVDDTLYYGKGTGGTGGTASSIVPVAGNGMGQSSTLPLVNATPGLTGISSLWSRSDHVHPTDLTRAPTASPSFTGLVTIGGTIGGTGMTLYMASPAAIGGTAPAAGTFTNLVATTSLSGAGVTALFASPPAIGGTAPAAGTFTNLTASGTVSGAGFTALLSGYATTGSIPTASITTPLMDGVAAIGTGTAYAISNHVHPTDTTRAPTAAPVFTGLVNISGTIGGAGMIAYFASPPPVGATTASTGAFTTLAISSTISGTGVNALFAAPPSIGSTTAGSGAFTTLSATGTVSGAGFTNYLASPPAIGGTAPAAGTFTNLTASGTVSGAGFTALLSGYATTGSIPVASITVPLVDSGSGSVGTGTAYAISNHVHPTDTTRAPVASPVFTGNPTSTTNPLAADSSQSLATTSWVKGLAYAPLASPAFTGTPTSTTNPLNADSSQALATTSWVKGLRQDQFLPPNTDVSWGTHRITNLLDPSLPTDAATKNYVDQNATGLSSKGAVVIATTANIGGTFPPITLLTIDGYTVVQNDRVLVKDQVTQANNGIYVVAASGTPWARSADMNTWPQVPQAYVFVSGGTVNSGSSWVCNSPVSGTLGTTAIVWVQFSQAAQTTAGNGLNKVGNTFNVVGTTNRITVGVAVDIAATYVGQTSITTVGTITNGTWAATDITVPNGGTGVSTLAAGYVKANGVNPFTSASSIPNTDVTGLGTMSTQNSNNVVITGGSIDNVTFDMGSF